MTVSDHILLAVCGVGAAFVFGYAFWIKVRQLSFRADLMEIGLDLRDKVAALGGLEDKGYVQAAWSVKAIMAFTDKLSLPMLFHLFAVSRDVARGQDDSLWSGDPAIEAAIREAIGRTNRRIACYVFHQTLAGLAVLTLLSVLPKSLLRKGVEREAAEAVVPLRAFYKSPPTANQEPVTAGSC
jgi:hypothetical protein